MKAFFGINEYTLDGKNRLFLPPRYREHLASEKGKYFVVTTGLGKCLYLFLPSQWEALLADNMKVFSSAKKEEERAFKRFFFGNASEAEPDSMGRILLPRHHKQYAGLDKKIVIVGVGNKAEIWDETRWNRYRAKEITPNEQKFSRIYDI